MLHVAILSVHDLIIFIITLYGNAVIFHQAICNFSHAWTIKYQETDQVYLSKNVNELVINFTKPNTYKVLASTNCNGYMLSSSHIISIESKWSFTYLYMVYMNI